MAWVELHKRRQRGPPILAFVNAGVLALVFMQFQPDHLGQPPFWKQAYVDVFRMLQQYWVANIFWRNTLHNWQERIFRCFQRIVNRSSNSLLGISMQFKCQDITVHTRSRI